MQPDVCVIVPTIREYECVREYVANAREHGFDVDRLHFCLVTEDFCDVAAMRSMLAELDVSGEVFDGTAREAWYERQGVAEYGHVVPAASHAETSFGLLYAWANPQFEYCVFVDDDTLPHDEWDFFGRHLENLAFEGEVESVASDEQWVNVLYQNADEHGLYPRGYPYAAMDETVEVGRERVDTVVASQGLWTNVPDLDAVRILMDGDLEGQAQTLTGFEDFERDFVAAEGNYLTVCSMNLAFRRCVIPAFYQLPMDDNEWDVGRFDDIWSGVFLKRACDLLGAQIYNGEPICEHNKAPRSTFDDLHNEVAGLECNEHLWEVVDDVGAEDVLAFADADERAGDQSAAADACDQSTDLGAGAQSSSAAASEPDDALLQPDAEGFAAVFEAMARRLADGEFDEYRNGAFLPYVGEHMLDWLACLDELEQASTPVGEDAPAVADD